MSSKIWRTSSAALLTAALLAGCSSTDATAHRTPPSTARPSPTSTAAAGWQRLPDLPLSLRHDSLGIYLNGTVLALGGSASTFSGGPLQLPGLRDSAALDLATRTWHQIATAPWGPAEASAHVVVGDKVLLARNGPGAWASYDSTADTWTRVPAPPQPISQPTMAVSGRRVFVLDKYVSESPAPVQVLDLDTNAWSTLPPSRHEPPIDDRTVLYTDTGLVVMGSDLSPHQSGTHRQPAFAETWNGSRWSRFASDHAAGLGWYWTGKRIIAPYRDTRHESGRGPKYEFRAGAFDPSTHRWTDLPWLPARTHDLLDLYSASENGGRVLSRGYLYDDGTGTSTPITKPSTWLNQTQVLTDDAIVLFSGVRAKPGQKFARVTQLEVTGEAWLLSVPTSS